MLKFKKRLFNSTSKRKSFDGPEEFIKDRIGEVCSNGKSSVEEVTYLFVNDCDKF